MNMLINAKNLSLAYPAPQGGLRGVFSRTAPPPLALDNINFQLKQGERLALVGLNGSGKSTLLRTIAGIYPPKIGSMEVFGSVAALFNLGVGMRMDLSGTKNIILQGLANGHDLDHLKDIAAEIIEFSGLEAVIHQPLHTYSQGMAMRLSFSIATALKPEILLLDEWIGAGDRIFRMKAQARLETMVADTGGLVLASHNSHIVKRYCSKAIWLSAGKIVIKGDVETVLNAFEEGTNADKRSDKVR